MSLSEKIKCEIERVTKLKTSLEERKTTQNNLLTEEDSKRLSDCESKLSALKTVQKLAEFAEQLDTKNNASNNILNNLCTGLETFLGFDSASKGYTGQGIVYSDLDRLCDGVMGFLSGVLSAVKDDENVRHYYDFNSCIKALNENIHKGSGKLSVAINAVTGALSAWDGTLKGTTEGVKTAFQNIRDKHLTDNNGFKKALNSLNNIRDPVQLDQVATKLGDCINQAGELQKLYVLAEQAYAHLDSRLIDKLKDPVNNIKAQVESFVEAAKNTELEKVVKASENELQSMKHHLNEMVNNRLTTLGIKLHDYFKSNIQDPITNVKKALTEVDADLQSWIERAEKIAEYGMHQAGEILKKVKADDAGKKAGDEAKNWKKVEQGAEELKVKANLLYKAANEAKEKLKILVPEALQGVLELDRAVRKELYDMKGKLQTRIRAYVKNVLLRAIQDRVRQITQPTTGLDGIIMKVKEWAEGFGEESEHGTFRDKVEDWVEYIVKHNEMVKGFLNQYIKHGSNRNKLRAAGNLGDDQTLFSETGILQITQTIRTHLTNNLIELCGKAVDEAIKNKDSDDADITKYVSAVQTGCAMFANLLVKKLRGENGGIKIDFVKVAKDVESKLTGSSVDEITDANSNLQYAVKCIINQLPVEAIKTGEELYSFATGDSEMSEKVHAAFDVAKLLFDSLQTASTNGTGNHPYDVHDKTDEVLNEEIGQDNDGDGKIDKLSDTTFGIYNGYIKQNTVPNIKLPGAQLSGNIGEGTLPAKIGDIQRQVVNEHLKNVENQQTPTDLSTTIPSDVNQRFYNDTFDKMLTLVEENLSELMTSIRNLTEKATESDDLTQKKGVRNYFQELQELIKDRGPRSRDGSQDTNKSLNKIKERLHNIIGPRSGNSLDTLASLVNKSGEFYSLVSSVTDEAIKEIGAEVTQQAAERIKNIQREAKSAYHLKINKMFSTLRTVVYYKSEEIKQIIDKDLQSGVKGLIKDLSKNLENEMKNKVISGNKISDVYKNVGAFSTKLHPFLSALLKYTKDDLQKIAPTTQLDKFGKHLQMPFSILADVGHFSSAFANTLSTLSSTSALDPQALPDAGRPVLRALRDGMMGFVGELGKAYISKYDGHSDHIEFDKLVIRDKDGNEKLSENGKNLSKVFFTSLGIILENLQTLKDKCENVTKYGWKDKKISESYEGRENALGLFLQRCGYDVATNQDSKEGELKFPLTGFNGDMIAKKLNETKFGRSHRVSEHLNKCESNLNQRGEQKKKDDFYLFDLFDCLLSHVDKYNEVCHYATTFSKRQPCTVYEMLVWCSGLTYNPVYHELQLNGFNSLLDKPKSKGSDGNKDEDEEEEGPTVEDSTALGLDAYPSDITFNSVHDAVAHITSKCHDILTTIVGTGDAETVYGCDYSNNSLALSYPADPAQCFETLLDILRRLLPQLRYLLTKCSTKAEHNGWRNCEYGKDVPTSKSHCNEQPSDKVTSKAACQPTCQANSKVNCQPTSPLMSYLNDCLPGHLPHHVTSIGCKSVCSNCPRNKPGQPCLTPLGFRGFSCSTRTGRHLYDILVTFLGDVDLSRLLCLLPKPPATLPEHFGFALSLVNGWKNGSKYNPKTLRDNIESSIARSSIKLYVNPENFTNVICNAYRTTHTTLLDKNHLPQYADLSSLAMPTVCTAADVKCAPYLSSLSCDLYYHLAKKNAGLYLSWITYLPWTFWDLLNSLYNAFCFINCQDWGCRGCLRGDKCKKGSHGVVDEDKPNNKCQCSSIVDCKGVAPTLYQYGFVFGEASTLNDSQSPKKCSDFCSQLKNVLQSQYFKDLFKECDNFLWTIRTPFSYLVLALWLLSFLYLLHIMVIRLDLLHIKSHLHSPSSHRIAAQSLLAAGRVNKLNRVFYLQP